MEVIVRKSPPLWLMTLGGVGVAAILGGLVWALFVAARNFSHIGV